MGTFRVHLEFDLDIRDPLRARLLTADYLSRYAKEAETQGVRSASISGSPEVASFDMATHERVAASIVAMQFLFRGAQTDPCAVISNVQVRNEPVGQEAPDQRRG